MADRSDQAIARPGGGAMTPSELVELYGSFQRRLEQLVRGGVQAQNAVVEDACQVAWAELIRYRQRVALQSAPSWLVRTAIHEALRLVQAEDREDSLELALQELPEVSLSQVDPGPEDHVWQRERVESLRLLSARQQRLVWLRALGLTYEEMASHEHCTSRTVHRQLERAQRAMRILEGGEPRRAAA